MAMYRGLSFSAMDGFQIVMMTINTLTRIINQDINIGEYNIETKASAMVSISTKD
jgi:hypothetical protein